MAPRHRGEPLGAAEVLLVRLDGVPLDEQDEARRRLDAAGHPHRAAAGRRREDLAGPEVRRDESSSAPGGRRCRRLRGPCAAEPASRSAQPRAGSHPSHLAHWSHAWSGAVRRRGGGGRRGCAVVAVGMARAPSGERREPHERRRRRRRAPTGRRTPRSSRPRRRSARAPRGRRPRTPRRRPVCDHRSTPTPAAATTASARTPATTTAAAPAARRRLRAAASGAATPHAAPPPRAAAALPLRLLHRNGATRGDHGRRPRRTSSTTATLQAWTKAPGGGWRLAAGDLRARRRRTGIGTSPSEIKSATPIGQLHADPGLRHYSDPGTALPYCSTTPADWWISQAGSALQHPPALLVGLRVHPGRPERAPLLRDAVLQLRRRDRLQHAQRPGGMQPGGGSAFFLHVTAARRPPAASRYRRATWSGSCAGSTPSAHPRILIGVG